MMGGLPVTRFTLADAERAREEWGANCGPGAVAAIMGMTLDEVRPHFAAAGFAAKHYTNPTMMRDVLRRIARPHQPLKVLGWPNWGLVRIQWEGPWTKPGVPMRARYRHTHWVGGAVLNGGAGVFDINCINNGSGWASFENWEALLVPWLLKECQPKANGRWHKTHVIEVERS